jgi:predicted GIY-YIG superfamily endonuclease
MSRFETLKHHINIITDFKIPLDMLYNVGMENERDFNPQTMTMATSQDFLRMWHKFYGSRKPIKSKYGSFYSQRIGGFVYIARDEDDNIKVGGANNVQKRMHDHIKKHPSLKLVATIYATRFMELERFVHYELEPFKVTREWYYSTDEKNDIFGKIENLIAKHGELFNAEFVNYETGE